MAPSWLDELEAFSPPPDELDWTKYANISPLGSTQPTVHDGLWDLSGPSARPPAATLIDNASCRLDSAQSISDRGSSSNSLPIIIPQQPPSEPSYPSAFLAELRAYNEHAHDSAAPSPVSPLTERTYSQASSGLSGPLSRHTLEKSEIREPFHNTQKRKKGVYDAEGREHAKIMRKEGACLRCRICRMKCDQGSPCANCEKIQHSALIYNQPCVRFKLRDLLPFRAGNSRTGDIRPRLRTYEWSQDHPDVRDIHIGHVWSNLPDNLGGPRLPIRVKQFNPGAGDHLSESYESESGETMIIKFPPFAYIDVDGEVMGEAMNLYLDESCRLTEKAIDSEITDTLILLLLKEARRYASLGGSHSADGPTMVASALKILAASYVSEIQPAIVGGDTLGIPLVDNQSFMQHNQRLIPISLDYQIDNLYIAYKQRHFDHVRRGLKRLIYKAKRHERKETWYEIFLTTFVLLLNLEMVHGKQTGFVRKYKNNNVNAFAYASKTKRAMVEEWRYSAKNLICHFRCVVRGMDPFGKQWTKEFQKEAKLDDDSLAVVTKLGQLITDRRDELRELAERDLNNDEATPMLWIAQMFVQD